MQVKLLKVYRFLVREIIVLCLVTQSCPALCHPMGCSPPGFSVHEDSPGKNTAVGFHALLQGIYQTRGSNPASCIASGFFAIWATREAQEYWSGRPIPSPGYLPDPGIKLGLPALQTSWATREAQRDYYWWMKSKNWGSNKGIEYLLLPF